MRVRPGDGRGHGQPDAGASQELRMQSVQTTEGSDVQDVHDPVNAPRHYRSHPSGVECISVTEHFGFNVGNAIKYLWRAGLKSDNAIEDLRKAAWYVNREIERVLRSTPTDTEAGE